jgi:hypothetical protein
MIARKGFHYVEGSMYSTSPKAKRDAGIYAPMPPLDNIT